MTPAYNGLIQRGNASLPVQAPVVHRARQEQRIAHGRVQDRKILFGDGRLSIFICHLPAIVSMDLSWMALRVCTPFRK